MTDSENLIPTATAQQPKPDHDIHVKGVPFNTWCRARHNALQSQMSLKQYITRLLEQCVPIEAGPNHPALGKETSPGESTNE